MNTGTVLCNFLNRLTCSILFVISGNGSRDPIVLSKLHGVFESNNLILGGFGHQRRDLCLKARRPLSSVIYSTRHETISYS